MTDAQQPIRFDAAQRDSFYRLVEARRDMRHFVSGARVDEAILQRLLHAAHCAPAVGLMPAWRLLRIVDPAQRQGIAELVEAERVATAAALGERQAEFLRLKVEGARECAELLVIALAPDDGTVFGRRTLPQEMAICTLACAVENLWLAARVENLGMGWVSMFDPEALARLLEMPAGARPLGVLCLGPVHTFYEAPMLELEGWRQARPLSELVFTDRWGDTVAQPGGRA
jgi:5,6-dimethylbenzimidazole synthase